MPHSIGRRMTSAGTGDRLRRIRFADAGAPRAKAACPARAREAAVAMPSVGEGNRPRAAPSQRLRTIDTPCCAEPP